MPELGPFLLAVAACVGGSWAISRDSISAPLRDWLWCRGWRERPFTPEEGVGSTVEAIPGRALPRWLWQLLDCPLCTGSWLCLFGTAAILGWHLFSVVWWLTAWGMRGAHLLVTKILLRL